MLVTYAQVAVAIPLLFLVTPQAPQFAYLFGVVFGFAMGADYMLIPLMAADLFGLRTLGRAMSAIVPSDTIDAVLVAQPDRAGCAPRGAATAARCGWRADRRGRRGRDRAAARASARRAQGVHERGGAGTAFAVRPGLGTHASTQARLITISLTKEIQV